MRRLGLPYAAVVLLIFPLQLAMSGYRGGFSFVPKSAQLGRVSFPTSCAPEAKPTLEKGLAMLHSFQ